MAEKKKAKKPYRALQIISMLYIGVGFIVMFLSIVGGAITLLSSSSSVYVNGTLYSTGSNVGVGLATIVGGLFTALGFFAVGQIIQVVLEMVENSRHQSEMLERVARALVRREG